MKPDETDDPYELAPPDEPPRPPRPAPSPVAPAPGSPAPLDYRTPKRPVGGADKPPTQRAAAPADDTDRLRNQQLPLGILLAGLAVELAAAYLGSPTIAAAAVEVTLTLVVPGVLLVVAALIAARLAHIDLGGPRTAILKLTAVVVGAAAVVTLLSPVLDALPYVPTMFDSAIPVGWLLGLAVYFGAQFVLVGVLFDLDESDTRFCVMVMFVVWVATHFGLMALASRA